LADYRDGAERALEQGDEPDEEGDRSGDGGDGERRHSRQRSEQSREDMLLVVEAGRPVAVEMRDLSAFDDERPQGEGEDGDESDAATERAPVEEALHDSAPLIPDRPGERNATVRDHAVGAYFASGYWLLTHPSKPSSSTTWFR
jgi:hypothetical protein